MRAAKAGSGSDRAAHRAHAATLARTITNVHRASGAGVMSAWESRYVSDDQASTRSVFRFRQPMQ
jgi:hypothetical protein